MARRAARDLEALRIRRLHDVLACIIPLDRDLVTPFRVERERLQDRPGAFLVGRPDLQRHAETNRQALQPDMGRKGRNRVGDPARNGGPCRLANLNKGWRSRRLFRTPLLK